MKLLFLLPLLTASNLLLALPVLAGGDGSAGGNSGFNPVGSPAPIGTCSFLSIRCSEPIVPVATYAAPLGIALVAAGMSAVTADGILALLKHQTVNSITPDDAALNLVIQLELAGAEEPSAKALVASLNKLGAEPTLENLKLAVSKFNALVNSADGKALESLAKSFTPIRVYLVEVINNTHFAS